MIFFLPKEKGESFLGLNNSVKMSVFKSSKGGCGQKCLKTNINFSCFFLLFINLADSWESNEIYSNQHKIEKSPLK